MTSRARFGDFLSAAHRHLDPASSEHGRAGVQGGADEAARSLHRTLTVMGRYLEDLGPSFAGLTPHAHTELGPWPQALVQARKALANSAGFLRADRLTPRRTARPPVSQLARRLDAVTVSLTAGSDLLQTHFAAGPDGARRDRSEWAPVIKSPTATRAILAEFAALGRQIARHGTAVAFGPAPDAKTTAEARRRLNASCQWLHALANAVHAADQQQPLPERDRELLRAVPSSALPPRRVPQPGDPVPVLVQGVIDSAERLRRATWAATNDGSWFHGLTITSLRWTAKAGLATSDHDTILLRTLAAQTDLPGYAGIREDLLAAADAAGQARRGWLVALHSLDEITTDMQDHASLVAQEAGCLAWWTGRLAYADPTWTPASGPAQDPRPPGELASSPGDVGAVVAAIHHASDTLTGLAYADRRQIRVGEHAGRILVPTRFLPETFDIPRPFGPAPHSHIQPLLDAYQEAGQVTALASRSVGAVAEQVHSSSRMITTVQAATHGEHQTHHERAADGHERSADHAPGSPRASPAVPGPVERTLRDLGVNRPDMLQRGAELDRASRQVILDAAASQDRDQRRSAPMLNRSTGTARLVNHVLENGDAHATALLRSPVSAKREAPEAEP